MRIKFSRIEAFELILIVLIIEVYLPSSVPSQTQPSGTYEEEKSACGNLSEDPILLSSESLKVKILIKSRSLNEKINPQEPDCTFLSINVFSGAEMQVLNKKF